MPNNPTTPARFWSKVDRSGGPAACWLWQGAIGAQGYGVQRFEGRQCRSHRLAYELTYGPIPAGFLVCHSCDTPACCNPEHLWLGTPAANMEDKNLKGRGRYPGARGELAGSALLTEDDVRAIRDRYAAGGVLYRELAEAYGVDRTTIHGLVRGRTWKHVEGVRPPLPRSVGERNPKARLTADDVRAIRARYAAGGVTLTRLATEYGVGISTIFSITSGQSWRHVT